MRIEAGAAPRAAGPTSRPAQSAGRTPPYVSVRHLKRGAWRMAYISRDGSENPYYGDLDETQARARGFALARLFDCPIEVDQ